jgi:hypothetical protein
MPVSAPRHALTLTTRRTSVVVVSRPSRVNVTSRASRTVLRTQRSSVVVKSTRSTVNVSGTKRSVLTRTCRTGPQGPPGDDWLPSPDQVPAGHTFISNGAAYVAVPVAGGGDMHQVMYDPDGVRGDAFKLSNLTGALDGGTF